VEPTTRGLDIRPETGADVDVIAAVTVARFATLQISDQTEQCVDSSRPGEMPVGMSLTPVSCGTELRILQEGVPAAFLTEACRLGWKQSLEQRAPRVELEIPD
jgi:hypothetical protein